MSKELVARAGIVPKLRLGTRVGKAVKSTRPHKVKLLDEKIVRITDSETGKPVEFMRYFVEEKGEKKRYDTRIKNKETGELSYLVERLADVPEGTEIILEMKKRGIKNYVEVTIEGETAVVEEDIHDGGNERVIN